MSNGSEAGSAGGARFTDEQLDRYQDTLVDRANWNAAGAAFRNGPLNGDEERMQEALAERTRVRACLRPGMTDPPS